MAFASSDGAPLLRFERRENDKTQQHEGGGRISGR
jgi:hypothetical protein